LRISFFDSEAPEEALALPFSKSEFLGMEFVFGISFEYSGKSPVIEVFMREK
jgi:hypothetical protein